MCRRSQATMGLLVMAFSAASAPAQISEPPERPLQTDPKDYKTETYSERGVQGMTSEKVKTASEIQGILKQMTAGLPDLIRTAETKTQGKALCAKVVEGHCVRPVNSRNIAANAGVNNLDNNNATDNKDIASTVNQSFGPNDPMVVVVCATNDGITEVLLAGKTGSVIDTYKSALYTPGKSAFLHEKGSSRSITQAWYSVPTHWHKATELAGKRILRGDNQQDIGEVEALVVDPDAGRVLYLIADFESTVGGGDKLHAIPLASARMTQDHKSFILDTIPNETTSSTAFPPDNWPNLVDESWANRVYSSFGDKPYWEESRLTDKSRSTTEIRSSSINPPKRWQKASDLMSKPIRNQAEEDLGSLKDLAIDMDSGRIMYGVLSFGGVLGLGDKLFAIPWSAMQLTPDYKTIVLAIDKDRLKNAKGFDENNWPNMADQRWATETYDYYRQPRYWDGRELSRAPIDD